MQNAQIIIPTIIIIICLLYLGDIFLNEMLKEGIITKNEKFCFFGVLCVVLFATAGILWVKYVNNLTLTEFLTEPYEQRFE